MKTQISRISRDAARRYSGVYQQQGRMLTDADWNELSDLVKERLDDVLRDLVGSGTPRRRGLVTPSGNIEWGYVYVDGIVAQVRPDDTATAGSKDFDYDKQVDFPDAPAITESDYLFYLDVWERPVVWLEDDQLRDPGLHGADTCTRTQTMAQVKWCPTGIDPELPAQNPTRGDAQLTLELREGSTEPDPCDPCADELQLHERLGNYLFRVEVHDVETDAAGQAQRLVVKWSGENGAEQYEIGKEPPGFKLSNGWVYELYSGAAEKHASEKHLGVHLVTASGFPVRGLLEEGYPESPSTDYSLVRRWDGYCVLERNPDGTWSLALDGEGKVRGMDRGVKLSTTNSDGAPGHVDLSVGLLEINLESIDLTLDHQSKTLVAGDFWYVPVREAVHESGDVLLDKGLPVGITHHYMTLATVSGGVEIPYPGNQCRRLGFPPLTDLRAGDVCFDNTRCDFPAAATVQEAIDRLCQENDLRFHNQHLHGWGIVCGLQVHCDESEEEDRQRVKLMRGYAIDCEGNDIVVDDPLSIDLAELIAKHDETNPNEPLLDDGKGTVCLTLDLDEAGEVEIGLEEYGSESDSMKALLDGTLLMDFYDDCIKGLVDALIEELTPGEDQEEALVGPGWKRLITLMNLLIQVINHANGRYVFLSQREHEILEALFDRLLDLMQSKTFCAMYEDIDFPDYPFPETRLSTVFGKGFHTRLRVHPSGKAVFTCGANNNTINVYDLASQEMVAQVEMPAGKGAEVEDVAFSPDGSQLYAIAVVGDTDTVFGIAEIPGDFRGEYKWQRRPRVLCGVRMMTLLAARTESPLLYATARGKGLYILNPDLLMDDTTPRPEPRYQFNAIGHLVLTGDGEWAYATARSEGTASTLYDSVVALHVGSPPGSDNAAPEGTLILAQATNGEISEGEDDIAVARDHAGDDRLFVVANELGSKSKKLLSFDADGASLIFASALTVQENGAIRLAFHGPSQQLLLSMENGYRLQLVDSSGQEVTTERHPVQISPISVAVDHSEEGRGGVYVLNFISNTVNLIPANELGTSQEFLDKLEAYREDVLLAYVGLLGGVLQYLKDCFCDHLLIKCPECDLEDKLYLACVEFRNNEVYKVCNFSKRKSVKSFPAIAYWLSLIPVMPFLKKGLEMACCSVLPNLFENLIAESQGGESAAASENRLNSKVVRAGVRTVGRVDFEREYRLQRQNLGVYGRLGADTMGDRFNVGAEPRPGIRKDVLLGSDVKEARLRLEDQSVVVDDVLAYDRNKAAENLVAFGKTPTRLPPGARVTLYEEGGNVLFYSVSEPQLVERISAEVREEIEDLEKRKASLRELSEVEAELTVVEARRTAAADLAGMKAELAKLEGRRTKMAETITGLEGHLEEILVQHRELSRKVARGRPVKDVEGVTAEIDVVLRELGIRTVAELAEVEHSVLSRRGTGITAAKARKLIKTAQERLLVHP